jgi:adenosylcobinamide-GDP ribazoletransferase
MKKQIRIFFTALQFLTRLRVPSSVGHSPEYMRQAPRYFPVAGWIVGGISALFYWIFSKTISTDVGIAASMIAGLLVTGAFHEDGFADVCDGFGGGWTKEKILLIMKDSRIGAFGAIALIAILGTRFLLLKELAPCSAFLMILIAAHSLSRLMPVLVMQTSRYVGDRDTSKSGSMTSQRIGTGGLVTAGVTGLVPFAGLPCAFLLVIAPALIVTWMLYRWFLRWIGGYTGDCLGAIQQVSEITIYLGFVVIWRYL